MSINYFQDLDYKLLGKTTEFKGNRIEVEKLHYYNPRHNEELYREHVLAGDATVIMPITEDNEVIMVRESRTPIQKMILEFPGGLVDPGETPEAGAIRELEEETGYRANYIKKMKEVYTAIGYSDEKTTIFLAKDLVKTQTNFDETEDIEVVKIPLEEVKAMLDNNEIVSSGEMVTLLHYFAYEYDKNK